MSILVICTGCKAQFRVDDKFAGKQGPCPKCKTILTVPAAVEVTIHEPEQFAQGGKDTKGRPVLKPLESRDSRISPLAWGGVTAGALVVLLGAWLLGPWLRDTLWLRSLLLSVVSVPLAVGSYILLRNVELEPLGGRQLWLRGLACGLAYAAIWGVLLLVPEEMFSGEPWVWFLVAPPAVLLGGGVALALFELDFGTGCMHYAFYLLVTLGLRALVGLPALWRAVEQPPLY